eukprot:jgi/Botrbrau1/22469/Bobra.0685s0002.1
MDLNMPSSITKRVTNPRKSLLSLHICSGSVQPYFESESVTFLKLAGCRMLQQEI